LDEDIWRVRTGFIQKRQHLLNLVQTGVKMPPLTKKDKKKFNDPLKELLKITINPLLELMMPDPEDLDGWLPFEGIYEDAVHQIRQLIISTKGRNSRKIYGAKTINPILQRARE
jgi:hypothetical protein